MRIKVAIVGRPNCGKSTIFNKIAQKNSAIVYNTPGVTRDRVEVDCNFFDLELHLVDTAGFDNTKVDDISLGMIRQSIKAIEDAQIILFVVDGRDGINRLDLAFANILRKHDKEIILVCNKCESEPSDDIMSEIYRLGLKNIVLISAEHKIGFPDLCHRIKECYTSRYGINVDESLKLQEESEEYAKQDRLSIAIVGRPNAGKSTMFNKILHEDRSIVSEIAGTTRDSIHKEITYNGTKIDLVDTAGIRKRLNIDDKIEEFSVESAFHAIRFAGVVVLCMDGKNAFEAQDLKIAHYAIEEGRGLVIVMNKWDVLNEDERKKAVKNMESFLTKAFPKVKGLPFFTISAKYDDDIKEILDECIALNNIWSKRINTGKLNAFIRTLRDKQSPPIYRGHEVKIKYATQIKTRPMTICLFTNFIDGLNDNYKNFVENEIRKEFGIFGVPIRMTVRKADNPFADKRQ